MDTSWNKVAKWYDSHLKGDVKKETYHEAIIIPKLLKLIREYVKRGSKIVDLACGQGKVTQEIAASDYVVSGIDLAPELIKLAKENTKGSGIEFIVDDASALKLETIKKIGHADAVTITLAIQNIQNLDGLFININKILKPQGYVFIVMNHPYFRVPKQTSWGFEGSVSQYRRVDAYISEKKIPIEMTPGEIANKGKSKLTWSFHRPLEKYIKTMRDNGLVLVDMEEWISNKVSEPGKRARAEDIARKEIPMFMAMGIVKK